MSYLPPDVKKDVTENVKLSEDVTEPVEEDLFITKVTKKTEIVKYIPTKIPGIENYVLVQAPRMKTTAKRSSVAGPVAKKTSRSYEILLRQMSLFLYKAR